MYPDDGSQNNRGKRKATDDLYPNNQPQTYEDKGKGRAIDQKDGVQTLDAATVENMNMILRSELEKTGGVDVAIEKRDPDYRD
jgi:hypothetical protein